MRAWMGRPPGGSCVPALHRVGTGRPLSHANELECDFIYTHTRAPTRKHIPKVSICLQRVLALRSPRTGLTAGGLSAWFHCVTLLYRPLTVEYLEWRTSKCTWVTAVQLIQECRFWIVYPPLGFLTICISSFPFLHLLNCFCEVTSLTCGNHSYLSLSVSGTQ